VTAIVAVPENRLDLFGPQFLAREGFVCESGERECVPTSPTLGRLLSCLEQMAVSLVFIPSRVCRCRHFSIAGLNHSASPYCPGFKRLACTPWEDENRPRVCSCARRWCLRARLLTVASPGPPAPGFAFCF